jgi:hypothetical protein
MTLLLLNILLAIVARIPDVVGLVTAAFATKEAKGTLMIRTAASLAALAVALLALPALAQDSLPSNAMLHKVPLSILSPDPDPVNGQGCNSGAMANAARADVDPVTGEKQAEPIIAIPLITASGNIARATEREQLTYACEQERTQ